MFRQVAAFVIALVLGYLPGLIGNLVNPNDWYDQLDKPPLHPPGWVFGVVWTPLYIAIGVSLYLLWRSNAANKQIAYVLWGTQAVLNAAWSLVFFGLEEPWIALMVIAALFVSILLGIVHFPRISRWASWLFVPYAVWVGFATYLNLGVAWLNRG